MKITILTLFPEMFSGPFDHSIIKRAVEKDLVSIHIANIRDFGIGPHRMVDDTPYGGGKGMVMRVDVLAKAIESVRDSKLTKEEKVILLDARGQTFNQSYGETLSKLSHLILICGHYEGVDERVRDLVDATVSLGDFIVTGGEIPAMILTDAIVRLVPGVLSEEATKNESFAKSDETFLLEHPQYTKPREFKGKGVPEVLVSGDHAKIDAWRKDLSVSITKTHRPDLLKD